eukprot:8394434-Pyramimonas_sp.AAC.1
MGPAEQAAVSARYLTPISLVLSVKYRCHRKAAAPTCRSRAASSWSSSSKWPAQTARAKSINACVFASRPCWS